MKYSYTVDVDVTPTEVAELVEVATQLPRVLRAFAHEMVEIQREAAISAAIRAARARAEAEAEAKAEAEEKANRRKGRRRRR